MKKVIYLNDNKIKGKAKKGDKEMRSYKFKPIMATPELSGIDAKSLIEETLVKRSEDSKDKNEKMLKILKKVRR